jgi:diguanylate cyclase (GGDEF)-like protein
MTGEPAERFGQGAILAVFVLLALVLATSLALAIYNSNKLNNLLEESVRSKVLAVCFAARDGIDMDLFMSINSKEDFEAHRAEANQIVTNLREMKNMVGATFIYTLKEIDGEYYFIFDTDESVGTQDNPSFSKYTPFPVHLAAFAGESNADIMNVTDEWGSYNTGAVPLYYQGRVVGILSVDFEDSYIVESRQATLFDTLLLIATIAVTMVVLLGILIMLLRRNQGTQKRLLRIANYDPITGLHNRNYLFSYLSTWSHSRQSTTASFAILFIGLDNLTEVNDKSGHDNGNELLRLVSEFFQHHSGEAENVGCIENITARIGGDKFLQVIADVTRADVLEQRARAMLSDFSAQPDFQPFISDFGTGLSIGGSLFPSQTSDYGELIKFADIAMCQARSQGKNNYLLYDETMGDGPEGVVLSIRTTQRKTRPQLIVPPHKGKA